MSVQSLERAPDREDRVGREGRGPFVPILLIVVSMVAWSGFQATQLIRERRDLVTLRSNQEPVVEQSTRIRNQLDSIARRLADLSGQGNAGARVLVEELGKRGVTINPNAPVAQPPK